MANSLFSQIPVQAPKRNFFDLSHDVKMTLDMGKLYPTVWFECMPGDSFNIGCAMQLRFAPLIAPVMHNINWYIHYFFVPYRILWENWEKYYQSPTDMTGDPVPVFPYARLGATGHGKGTLSDYLGAPPVGVSNIANYVEVSAMPYYAYGKILSDYYLDENLISDGDKNKVHNAIDGDNTAGISEATIMNRAWEKDYFTSALPWAQKGPTVNIPVGTLQDLKVFANDSSGLYTTLTGAPNNIAVPGTPTDNDDVGAGGLFAMAGELEATSINDWRRAVKLQEFLERMARGGSRPTEITRSVFGVTPPDYRLQRSEYITGARGQVIISEVLATADGFGSGGSSSPLGTQAGHAMGVGTGYPGKYFCTEHGIIMGLLSVMPKPAYKDGVFSTFLRKGDALDSLPWPQFANLGEQPIKNVEVYADTNATDQQETFGYTPRYAQYKYMPNRVAGDFRESLSYWTLVRDFTSNGDFTVPLDLEFVSCNPGKDIFAVTDDNVNSLYAHIFHSIKSKRPLAKWGVATI